MSSSDAVVAYKGDYHNNQLWKFQKEGPDLYRIFNHSYPEHKLCKNDFSRFIKSFNGPDHDDQLWKLVRRFDAKQENTIIWAADNRQGSADYSETIEVTNGLTTQSSTTMSTTLGMGVSLSASVHAGSMSAEAAAEFHQEITNTVTNASEETWSRTTTTTFTAPAGKNYRVVQNTCMFESALAVDNCALKCNYIIEETDGEFYD